MGKLGGPPPNKVIPHQKIWTRKIGQIIAKKRGLCVGETLGKKSATVIPNTPFPPMGTEEKENGEKGNTSGEGANGQSKSPLRRTKGIATSEGQFHTSKPEGRLRKFNEKSKREPKRGEKNARKWGQKTTHCRDHEERRGNGRRGWGTKTGVAACSSGLCWRWGG